MLKSRRLNQNHCQCGEKISDHKSRCWECEDEVRRAKKRNAYHAKRVSLGSNTWNGRGVGEGQDTTRGDHRGRVEPRNRPENGRSAAVNAASVK